MDSTRTFRTSRRSAAGSHEAITFRLRPPVRVHQITDELPFGEPAGERFPADLERVNEGARDEFARQQGLTAGRTAVFLGGVDENKGIDSLLKAAVRIAQSLPGFVLLVGSARPQSQRGIELQARGGPVRFLDRVDGFPKAIALSSSQVMLVPEWVGLDAVETLVGVGQSSRRDTHPTPRSSSTWGRDGTRS